MAMTLSLVLAGSIDPKPKTIPKMAIKKPLSTFVPKFDPLPVVTSSFTKKAKQEAEVLRIVEELQGQVKEEDPAFALLVKMEKVYQFKHDTHCPPVTRDSETLTCNGEQYYGRNFQGASPFTSCHSTAHVKAKIFFHERVVSLLTDLFQKLPPDALFSHQKELLSLYNEHIQAVEKWTLRLEDIRKVESHPKVPSDPKILMGITQAQKLGLSGKKVLVGINEKGISKHSALKSLSSTQAKGDQNEERHATQVAGVIAAEKIGVAPGANVSFFDCLDVADIAKVKNKGVIINMSTLETNPYHSLFLPGDDTLESMTHAAIEKFVRRSCHDPKDFDKIVAILADKRTNKAQKKHALKDFILLNQRCIHEKYASMAAGNLLVMAAGNKSVILTENEQERGHFFFLQDKAIAESSILVVNVEDDGLTPHPSSNLPGDFGDMALCACGTDVLTTCEKDKYCKATGTSIAAPEVTGVAALIKEAYPMLNTQEIRVCLLEGAKPIIMGEDGKPKLLESSMDLTNYDEVIIKKSRRLFGRGLLNAEGALEQAHLLAAKKAAAIRAASQIA